MRRKDLPEYRVWKGLRQRCQNPHEQYYSNYGGRGITYHPSWDDFEVFLADVGRRPGREYSLDRIDNNGNYEPGNVRWATRDIQRRNARNIRILSFDGRSQVIADWAAELDIPRDVLYGRLRWGWSIKEALTTPYDYRGPSRDVETGRFRRGNEVAGAARPVHSVSPAQGSVHQPGPESSPQGSAS